MHRLNPAEVEKLINNQNNSSPCITIYMPTHKTSSPPHMTEDQIRFKNLFSQALKDLSSREGHSEYSRQFEDMCRDLLETKDFWEHMNESMLLCARPGLFEYYHLPVDSDEYIAVSDHFHLAPVCGLVNDMADYYVLALAEQNPVLYRGNDYELRQTTVELPSSVKTALNIDEMHIKSVQFASVASPKGAQYHGHGGAKDTGDAERLQYFRIIDSIVNDYTESSLPLILSGVSSEIAEYKSVSRYTRILDKHIDGRYIERDMPKLHIEAKKIIFEEVTSKRHEETARRFHQYYGQGNGLASSNVNEIKDAAEKGRVDTLLINMYRHTRDTVRDNAGKVKKIVFPADKGSALIDYIANRVVSQGGKVFNLTYEEMPNGKLAAAVNRY
jgi:hypothetical protein